ncbi:MAG: aldehyde ferredoxin oxidoreductase family protein [Chloroflexi bacterium]|nr:aldehyde ferredoxin oxidoreductase family protein [Chloroflexota bacterium]
MSDRAFNGRILNVNLSTGEISPEDLPESMYRDLLGGYGLGSRLLFDRIPAGADPLGPDNILGFFPGLLTGTPLFGQRFQVVCKSPKNGGWGDANCGGDFGPMLKFTGYDGILFSGQAERPTYLYIEDDVVELRDASSYWGGLAIDVEDQMKEDLGKKISVAVIGPAGEHQSIMAGIANERGRLAARSGVGAVMGSKRLKAVVVKPTKKIMAQNKDVLLTVKSSLEGFNANSKKFFTTFGTTGITANSAINGDAPVLNWGGVGVVDFVDERSMAGMNGPAVNESMEKKYACWHCPVACGAESVDGSDRGEFAFPKHTHRPEYETMGAFGVMNSVNDTDAMIAMNHWCNQYGLDSISTGATISFAIECFENGLLTKEDTDGIDLRWGNASAVLKALHAIGRREGHLGELLADGTRAAAEKIGPKAQQYVTSIDGEEPPMHDPKLEAGFAAAYALDPTPARHTLWSPGKSSKFPTMPEAPKDRKQTTGKGPQLKAAHEQAHIMNSAGMCYFIYTMSPTDRIPEWVNLVTGWDTTHEELDRVGERIANLRMAFAVKHGNNPAAREVPGRLIGDPPQATGPHEGFTVDLETMKQDWFNLAGWDLTTSKPSRARLEALGLADVAEALGV